MNTASPLLVRPDAAIAQGQPAFDDPSLAAAASANGAIAAWRQAMAGGRDATCQAAANARGDFSVGLRDAQGRVFLAVDRFAVHTLCYTLRDGELHFAERADSLADSSQALDPQALFDYLYYHVIPSPRTVYGGVHRVPPGHFAWFEGGRLTVAPYWTPHFVEPRIASFPDLRDEFLGHLRNAVTRRLDGSLPACFLSGGTDSSTIAGLITECADRPAASYSIGFEAEGYDEMAYARIAAKRFGTHHHEYYVTPADLVASIPKMARYLDQPFGNSSALPAHICAERAREDGVTRLLAGDGGDELFGGNTRYAKQRVFGWWDHVPAALRANVLEPVFDRKWVARAPLLKKGSSYIEQARVPLPDRLQMYNLLWRLGPAAILTPEFLAQVDLDGPAKDQRAVWAQVSGSSQLNAMLAYDWRYTLAESDLPKVRASTQLAGVDAVYPFLDRDLLDFSQKLPSEYKLKRLKLRWFFKEALRGFLPDEILTKKKHGFGLPFGFWVNRDAALKRLASDSLQTVAERGVVKPSFVRELVDVHLPAYPGYYGELVWILMMLEQWLQHHAPAYRVR